MLHRGTAQLSNIWCSVSFAIKFPIWKWIYVRHCFSLSSINLHSSFMPSDRSMMMKKKKKKTCQSSIKQATQRKGEEKGTRWKEPKSWQVNEHQITYLRSKDEDSSSLLLLAKQNSHTSTYTTSLVIIILKSHESSYTSFSHYYCISSNDKLLLHMQNASCLSLSSTNICRFLISQLSDYYFFSPQFCDVAWVAIIHKYI